MARLTTAACGAAACLGAATAAFGIGRAMQPAAAPLLPGLMICTPGAVAPGGATYPRSVRGRLWHNRQNMASPVDLPAPPL